MKKIIITGGAALISASVVRHFISRYSTYNIINLDKLTYAGNLSGLNDFELAPNYNFIKSNFSNNYGFHHFPEKLIPLAINKPIIRHRKLMLLTILVTLMDKNVTKKNYQATMKYNKVNS
ncbi:MAG: hypothetical protein V4541_03780 [Bacteroidota bacterium]